MTLDLFAESDGAELLAPGAWLLRGFALVDAPVLVAAIESITAAAPWRHMEIPGGLRMSVAMSNCGDYGWVADRRGYRYDRLDPHSGQPWPPLPAVFDRLARAAAVAAGYPDFAPDACLINCYRAGTRLSLHQDRDERDFSQPIVSVSLGLPAVFLFGGNRRDEQTARLPLQHGDVVVWGGPARLRYHGVLPLKPGRHPLTGDCRINLTFRRAG
ncbi:DNA oxidative demethylase AlkB [Chitinimonas lacunae]|uniref:DNA oxidative demethylase AlkB n=1 Tax=Chitinimonas lacunae TaxID=1963018 RepID=A0ABV8MSY6_9NEIS